MGLGFIIKHHRISKKCNCEKLGNTHPSGWHNHTKGQEVAHLKIVEAGYSAAPICARPPTS